MGGLDVCVKNCNFVASINPVNRVMAKMYIRVPHYVAAFFRNRNEFKPIEVGKPVSVDNIPVLWDMLMSGIVRNPNERLVKEGCFCERMWRKMLRGQYLFMHEGKIDRDPHVHLTDAEVRELCGWEATDRSDNSEYLCIKLPPYVYQYGRQIATDGQWQLASFTCKAFKGYVRDYFWDCALRYVDAFVKAGDKLGVKHSQAEGFERFLARYDVRTGGSEKDMKTLKRGYFRRVKTQDAKQYDFVDFGDTK